MERKTSPKPSKDVINKLKELIDNKWGTSDTFKKYIYLKDAHNGYAIPAKVVQTSDPDVPYELLLPDGYHFLDTLTHSNLYRTLSELDSDARFLYVEPCDTKMDCGCKNKIIKNQPQ
jgi:hypothetical protein